MQKASHRSPQAERRYGSCPLHIPHAVANCIQSGPGDIRRKVRLSLLHDTLQVPCEQSSSSSIPMGLLHLNNGRPAGRRGGWGGRENHSPFPSLVNSLQSLWGMNVRAAPPGPPSHPSQSQHEVVHPRRANPWFCTRCHVT